MILFILMVLTSVHRTQQHLTYPVNYCELAAVCIHDNRVVCAATENGCSRRTFLDQCDMYEYNCDFGSRYVVICCGGKKPDTDYFENDIEKNSNAKNEENCTEYYIPPCDRPTTWFTTKTTTVSSEYNLSIEPIPTTYSVPSTNTVPPTYTEPSTYTVPSTSTLASTYTIPSTNFECPLIVLPNDTDLVRENCRHVEIAPEIKVTTTQAPENLKLKGVDEITETSSTKPYSWWYPTAPCKSIRCERPVIWITTTRKRRRNFGHRY